MEWLGAMAPRAAIAQTWASAAGGIFLEIVEPWPVQFSIVALLVWLTLKVMSRVYTGDLQNTLIGPIAIRSHGATASGKLQKISAPKVTLPQTMNGQHAKCQFYYVYDDADGEQIEVRLREPKRRRKPKRAGQYLFDVRDRRFNRNDAPFVLGREDVGPDVATSDIHVHNPDGDGGNSEQGAATPEKVTDWLALQKARDLDATGTEIVSVPDTTLEFVGNARAEYIADRAAAIAARRAKRAPLRWFDPNTADKRPAVVGAYYIKLSFETGTWFVLFEHPDRELKMTAWLTVLTSFFGFLIGKMP